MNSTRVFVSRTGKSRSLSLLTVRGPARRLKAAARYRPSHRSLLVDVTAPVSAESPALQLGCVLLPVSRAFTQSLPGLRLAAELAHDRDCHLVVVYSKRARPADFPKELALALGDRLVLINHSRVHLDWKPQLESSRQRLGKFHRKNDAAEKRNLGLALASVAGWESVLFLDDDIFSATAEPTLDRVGLGNALRTLRTRPELRAVGWSAKNMDDHSVVGHSRELVRLPQDLFVGAGALLVRCDARTPYFPNIYNHDWMFLIVLAKKAADPRRAIGWAGTVRQLEYNPYVRGRARSEEAGDILGEGLMNLLEDHGTQIDSHSTSEFWDQALLMRRDLVARLQTKVGRQMLKSGAKRKAFLARVLRALTAAEEVNHDLKGADLARYVGILTRDEESWEGHLTALSRAFVNRPGARQVLVSLQSGKPPTAAWRAVPLPETDSQYSIKAASPAHGPSPSARLTDSDAQAASDEGVPSRRPRPRWRKGFDVRPRRPVSGSSAPPQFAPEPAGALPQREVAGIG